VTGEVSQWVQDILKKYFGKIKKLKEIYETSINY